MPFRDLREFIHKCEEMGEIQRIGEEVDWNLEVGAITRRCCEVSAPAPLFEKIKDYGDGYRILGAPLATFRRLAIAMDMNPDSSFRDILHRYHTGRQNPIEPRIVTDGPCKENVHIGEDVNLLEFPAPYIHQGDGGRYISTWHIIITKDPDSDWVNWGMYRQMIYDRATLGGLLYPAQHIGIHYRQKYEPRGEAMEFAVAIGTEPITALLGTAPIPAGVNEADIVGGIRGEPVDLIKCETVNLYVPATSEIVIEGVVPPKERRVEGPFGEHAGYRAMPSLPRPAYHVTAVTHRNNPILAMSCMGTPVDDADIAQSITWSSAVLEQLQRAEIPVTGIYAPPEACQALVVVSTKVPYAYVSSQIACCIWGQRPGLMMPKVIIVDDDVDPTDMKQVFHAWATKCSPTRGRTVIPRAVIDTAFAYHSFEDLKDNAGANVYYDCTYPMRWAPEDRPQRSSFNDIYPDDVKRKVLANWHEYGF